MSDVSLLDKNSKKSVEGEDHVSKMRNNKVNFSAQYIRVNKNEISYSALSNQIKYIFVVSLKQCYDSRVMKKVFHKWQDDEVTFQPRKLILTNQEASQLIWRMQRIMLKHKMMESSVSLAEEVQTLQKQLYSYLNSYKDMQDKQSQLTTLELDNQGKQRSLALVQKIIKYKGWLAEKVPIIKEQIINKKEQLKHCEKEIQFANQSTARLSKHLTKIIIKEVRNLLKQTIIGILEISNKIINQGEVDDQQVYVIFEQAYRTIKITKTTVVKYFGSDFYLEKVNYFAALMTERMQIIDEMELINNNIFCCHVCMKVCKLQKLKFCQIPIGLTQIKSYPSTDYMNYRKNYLEGDFFYQPTKAHIIPFYIYNKNSKDKLTCNRAFCQECVPQCIDKPFACPYCLGFCACRRCEKAVAIVRLMAIDYQNDPEGMKPYHQLLKLFGDEQHKDISQYLKIRQPNQLTEFYLTKKIFVSFNDKRSIPKIKLNNFKKPLNFYIFNTNKVKPKILHLSTQGKFVQSAQRQQNQKSNIEISVLPKNYDDYLNQLLDPIFDKNYPKENYLSLNDKQPI